MVVLDCGLQDRRALGLASVQPGANGLSRQRLRRIANSARNWIVPSFVSTADEVKLRRPVTDTLPSCSTMRASVRLTTRNCVLGYDDGWSDRVAEMVVSNALSPPAAARRAVGQVARPVTPPIGAVTWCTIGSAPRRAGASPSRIALRRRQWVRPRSWLWS
jgi:hypothetical protein